MGDVMKPRISRCLRDLHLPAFAENFSPQAALAANDGWPYDRYLLTLCDLELSQRQQRRMERLLSESRLPREKTLDSFDRSRLKKTHQAQVSVLLV
jgi:DNA replication protein DnaC